MKSSTKFIKLIILCQVLLGRYFNLGQSKLRCFFIKLYCICFSLTISTLLYFRVDSIYTFVTFVYIEYMCIVVIALFNTDDYFFNFYNSIRINDRIIGFKKISLFTKYLSAIIITTAILRLFLTVMRYLSTPNDYFDTLVSMVLMLVCIDLSHIFVVIIFSILHVRIKILRSFLEKNDIPIIIIGRNEVDISIKNIRKSLYYYDNLLDNMELVDHQVQYQVMFFLPIFFCFN